MRRAAARAERLIRCYPPAWRARYGDEFAELLIADLTERPRSPWRTADVVRGGLLARLSAAGLAGPVRDPDGEARSSLAALGGSVAVFLAFGVGLWSQLTIGWQWSAPDTPTVAVAMKAMSAALLALVVLGLLAAGPIVWAVVRRHGRRLRGPVTLVLLGAAVLILGSRHFAHGWPGTGGRPWGEKALVPGGPASVAWAATLSITSYWAHPVRLGAFPAIEVAWMAIAPLAITGVVVGAAKTIRRVALAPAVLRYEAALGRAATIAMLGFLGGATCWLIGGSAGPRRLFASGAIDILDVAMMNAALVAALGAARRAGRLTAHH